MDTSQESDRLAARSYVPDPRRQRGRRCAWPLRLPLIAGALVSRERGVRAIGRWATEHAEELVAALGCPPVRPPPVPGAARPSTARRCAAPTGTGSPGV